MDRIDAMRLFLRVADAGSFSRAASDLDIGQPTVSRRIQDLEQQLGAELFQRTTRALRLTEAGQRFHQRAQDILADFDDAEREARGLDSQPVGQLRISAPSSFTAQILTPELASFMRKHPHVRVDLIADDNYTNLVTEGVDIAFRFGTLSDSSLMAKRVMLPYRGLWASPDYIAARGMATSPAELADHEGLIFRQSLQGNQWTLNHTKTGETQTIPINGRFKSSSADTLMQAAIEGLGVFVGPDWLVCPGVRAGKLVRVLPEWRAADLPVSVVWTGGKLRGKSRLFVDHITAALNALETVGA